MLNRINQTKLLWTVPSSPSPSDDDDCKTNLTAKALSNEDPDLISISSIQRFRLCESQAQQVLYEPSNQRDE